MFLIFIFLLVYINKNSNKMLTLITKNNLGFTKPKCNCGLSMNLQKIKKTRKTRESRQSRQSRQSRKNKSRKTGKFAKSRKNKK
jgi:hypothetical protein